jgi:hypothetical protein
MRTQRRNVWTNVEAELTGVKRNSTLEQRIPRNGFATRSPTCYSRTEGESVAAEEVPVSKEVLERHDQTQRAGRKLLTRHRTRWELPGPRTVAAPIASGSNPDLRLEIRHCTGT